jgi:hypothetical protein
MIVTLEFDTDDITDEDKKTLLGLMFGGLAQVKEAPPKDPTPAAPAKKAAAKAPAKKAAPAPETAASDTPSDLRTAAVDRARELLAKGGRDRVLAALKPSGAEKVSDLPDDALQAFYDEISGDGE